MIDLDALARAAHAAARPTTAQALLGARTLPLVHVITTLGPGDDPAVFQHGDLGRFAAYDRPRFTYQGVDL